MEFEDDEPTIPVESVELPLYANEAAYEEAVHAIQPWEEDVLSEEDSSGTRVRKKPPPTIYYEPVSSDEESGGQGFFNEAGIWQWFSDDSDIASR